MGDMNSNMVLVGFLIMLICQDIVAVKAFKKSAREGMLCAMIPGYLLYLCQPGGDAAGQAPDRLAGRAGIILMGFMR